MFWEQPVQFASQSDVGLRRGNNEDSTAVRLSKEADSFGEHGHLFVVADGMGGHAVGELASKLAVETVPLVYFKSQGTDRNDALRNAVVEANRVIYERGMANVDFRRMGTTCTALLLSPDGVTVAHVGDSRAYRVRDHRIDQLTFDHSLQWEMQRQGRVPPGRDGLLEARNVITRSLGPEPAVEVDMEGPFPVVDRDSFVLCSDGLTAHVQDGEIGAAVRYLPPEEACRFLVNLALVRGGSDNVTVTVVGIGASPSKSVSETSTRLQVVERSGPHRWFVVAACLLLVGSLVAGRLRAWSATSVLLALGVASVFAAVVMGRRRHEILQNETGTEGDTVVWRPHASASAQLTRRFLDELGSLERELERAAREEEWRVDWEKRDRASEDARESLAASRHSRAFASLATSIDALATGIVAQRKQVNRQARWGRATSD